MAPWFFSFIVSCLAFFAVVHSVTGSPGPLHGPWTLESISKLKGLELSVYWLGMVLVPLISLLLTLGIEKGLRLRPPSRPDLKNSIQKSPSSVAKWVMRGLLWVVIPAVLYGISPREPLNAEINFQNEGLKMAVVNQSLHGKIPYRDIYFQYGPGMEIAEPRVAFLLFGQTFSAYRRWMWYASPLGATAVFLLAAAVVRRKWILLVLFPVLTGIFWFTPRFMLPCVILGLVSFGWHKGTGPLRKRCSFLAGLLCWAAFFYSLESGLLTAFAIALAYGLIALIEWFDGRSTETIRIDLLPFVSGWAAVLLPFSIWGLAHGTIGIFLRDIFLVPGNQLTAWGKPTPAITEPMLALLSHPTLLWKPAGVWARWWLPVFIYSGSIVWALHRLSQGRKDVPVKLILVCALTGVFFFTVTLGRSDLEHWYKATPILWVLMVLMIEEAWGELKNSGLLYRAGALLLLLFFIAYAGSFSNLAMSASAFRQFAYHPKMPEPDEPRLARLGKLPTTSQDGEKISEVSGRIQRYAHPGDTVYIFGEDSLFYFLCDVVNPTRYANLSYVVGHRMSQEVVDDLRTKPPKLIIGKRHGSELFCEPYQLTILEFIRENYVDVETWRDFLFLVPREHPKNTSL